MRRTVRNTLISMLAVLAAAALLYGALLAVRAMSGADSLRLPGSGTTPHQNVEQPMRTIAADDPEAVYAIGVIVPRDVPPVTATDARAFFEALIATSSEPDASSRTFISLGESVQPALFLTASFVPLEVPADGALLFGEREPLGTADMIRRMERLMRERGADYGMIIRSDEVPDFVEFKKL